MFQYIRGCLTFFFVYIIYSDFQKLEWIPPQKQSSLTLPLGHVYVLGVSTVPFSTIFLL